MKRRKKDAYMLYHDSSIIMTLLPAEGYSSPPSSCQAACWLKQIACQAVTCFSHWKVRMETLWASYSLTSLLFLCCEIGRGCFLSPRGKGMWGSSATMTDLLSGWGTTFHCGEPLMFFKLIAPGVVRYTFLLI